MRWLVLLLGLLVFATSCGKRRARKQAEEDEQIIQQYIADNNLDASATGSGLYYVIENQGTGPNPTANSDVKVDYTGYYTSGQQFDKSPAGGITFNLQSVIQGWTEGIPYFKEGGNGVLLIPSALAYGSSGSGSVPPDAVLIFDVELVEVVN